MQTKKVIFPLLIFFLISTLACSLYTLRQANQLLGEGIKLFSVSDFRGALQKWETGIEICRKLNNNLEMSNFLGNIGNAYYHLGDYPTALSYYEQALQISINIGDKKGEGYALANIGNVYSDLGDYSTALSCYEQALRIQKEIGDKNGEGTNLGNIGSVYFNLSDYPTALSYHEKALQIQKEIGDKNGEGTVLVNIGNVYSFLSNYPKSLSYHEQALKIMRDIGDKNGEGSALVNIGNVYSYLSDYPSALSYYEQAFKIKEDIGDKNGEGATLGNIGNIYSDLSDYPKALSYYEKVLKINKEIGAKKGEGITLVNIGIVYSYLSDYPKALSYYEQALKIMRDIGDKNGEGSALGNIGNVYYHLGDYPEALSYYEQAFKIKEDIGVQTDMETGNIGDVYLEMEKFDEAKKYYDEIESDRKYAKYYLKLRDFNKSLEYAKNAIAREKNEIPRPFILSELYGFEALSNSKLQKNNESISSYLNQIEIIEKTRRALKEKEEKKSFFGKLVEPFEEIITPIYRLYANRQAIRDERISSKSLEEAGFFFSESTKARVFLEQLAEITKERLKTDLPVSLKNKEKELKEQIITLQAQLEPALKQGNDEYNHKQAELKEAEAKFNEFVDSLRRNNPEYANIFYPKPLEVSNILLQNNERLIEFEVIEDTTFVFLVRKGKVEKFISIPIKRDELRKKIKSFRTPFDERKLTLYKKTDSFDLYNLLLKDILLGIPKNAKLIIIPDEILETLPFELLLVSENGHYLDEDYEISYYPSATVLALQRSKSYSIPAKTLFGIADPVFGESDERASGVKVVTNSYYENMKRSLEDFYKISGKVFPRLPGTREELLRIGKIMDNPTLCFDLDASEERVKSTDLKPYKYIHFATHGILANEIPYIQQPALVLSLVKRDENNDGFLTLNEVLNLKMNAEVVVLSACKTGLGKEERGEGVSNLSRAFMYAGGRALIVSLWSVADESTVILMEESYKNLKVGKTKSEAIRLARKKLRQNPNFENPFYWAPFILVGE